MHIILLDKIPKLGNLGDQVHVKTGYARNYLIPQGKAVLANKKNIEYFRTRRIEFETKLAEIKLAAEKRAIKISELDNITISSKVGNEGKLFGSIGARIIADAITNAGISVNKNEVRLPNGVLRKIGHYKINIQVHSEIYANVNVVIIPK